MSELTLVRPKKTVAQRILGVFSSSIVNIVLLIVAVFWLVPTVGLFITSLRTAGDIAATGWWTVFTAPAQLTVENYTNLLSNTTITGSFLNTIVIAVPTTILVVMIGAIAAYGFAFLQFPGRDWLLIVVIILLAVPLQVVGNAFSLHLRPFRCTGSSSRCTECSETPKRLRPLRFLSGSISKRRAALRARWEASRCDRSTSRSGSRPDAVRRAPRHTGCRASANTTPQSTRSMRPSVGTSVTETGPRLIQCWCARQREFGTTSPAPFTTGSVRAATYGASRRGLLHG